MGEKVDELLDSLQTDVWNDEEEGLLDGEHSDYESLDETENDSEMTLLDSILAMILGAIPPPKDRSVQEHFSSLKQEHRAIVVDWKKAFGRIPKVRERDTATADVSQKHFPKEYLD